MIYTLTAWLLFQDPSWPADVEHFTSLEACEARQDQWSEDAVRYYDRQPGRLLAYAPASFCTQGPEPVMRPF